MKPHPLLAVCLFFCALPGGAGEVPRFARPGTIRFARWDGGPIMAKGCILSRYPPWFQGDRQAIEATTRWYDPSTVELARMGGFNWVYVTFSWGWSIPTEREQWAMVARYIEECHRSNIQVMAYMSGASMYWMDMFANHPESVDWIRLRDSVPVPYGSGLYPKDKGWFVSRYMADISKPEWLNFMKLRVAAAIEAGADAVYLDNLFRDMPVENFVEELMRFGRGLNRNFLLAINANARLYTAASASNFISTEDGTEPGFFGRQAVNNTGLLRSQWALSEGWKPAAVEYGGRKDSGDRFLVPIRPEGQQLSIAEAAANQCSFEFYSLGAFQRDLYMRRPEAIDNLKAAGIYNRFLEQHQDLYTDTKSLAGVAIVKDDTNWSGRKSGDSELASDIGYLNRLAARRVMYDIHYAATVSAADLRPYPIVYLFSARQMSEKAAREVEAYARQGGTAVVAEDASLADENGKPREDFALREMLGFSARARPDARIERRFGQGRVIYYPAYPTTERLAADLRALGLKQAVEIDAPPAVLFNARLKGNRTIVHLLNYDDSGAKAAVLRTSGATAVRAWSPDGGEAARATLADATRIEVPALKRYTVVVIEGEPWRATRDF